jgi:hypothetical protein
MGCMIKYLPHNGAMQKLIKRHDNILLVFTLHSYNNDELLDGRKECIGKAFHLKLHPATVI